jgi:hypothetical protein
MEAPTGSACFEPTIDREQPAKLFPPVSAFPWLSVVPVTIRRLSFSGPGKDNVDKNWLRWKPANVERLGG